MRPHHTGPTTSKGWEKGAGDSWDRQGAGHPPPRTWSSLAFISSWGKKTKADVVCVCGGWVRPGPPTVAPCWVDLGWGVVLGGIGEACPTRSSPHQPGIGQGSICQATHADTRGRPQPCPGPTGGPGRRAGSARSRGRLCCAGSGTPAGQRRRGRTSWRARCTCTWQGNMEDAHDQAGSPMSGVSPKAPTHQQAHNEHLL